MSAILYSYYIQFLPIIIMVSHVAGSSLEGERHPCVPGQLQHFNLTTGETTCCLPVYCDYAQFVQVCLVNGTDDICIGCPEGTTLAYKSSSFHLRTCYVKPACMQFPDMAALDSMTCECNRENGQHELPPEIIPPPGIGLGSQCQPLNMECGQGRQPVRDKCQDCPPGYFKSDTSKFGLCRQAKNCSALGLRIKTASTPKSNTVCDAPLPGFLSPTTPSADHGQSPTHPPISTLDDINVETVIVKEDTESYTWIAYVVVVGVFAVIVVLVLLFKRRKIQRRCRLTNDDVNDNQPLTTIISDENHLANGRTVSNGHASVSAQGNGIIRGAGHHVEGAGDLAKGASHSGGADHSGGVGHRVKGADHDNVEVGYKTESIETDPLLDSSLDATLTTVLDTQTNSRADSAIDHSINKRLNRDDDKNDNVATGCVTANGRGCPGVKRSSSSALSCNHSDVSRLSTTSKIVNTSLDDAQHGKEAREHSDVSRLSTTSKIVNTSLDDDQHGKEAREHSDVSRLSTTSKIVNTSLDDAQHGKEAREHSESGGSSVNCLYVTNNSDETSQKHVIDHDVEQTSQKHVIDHDVEQTSQKRVIDHDVEQTSQKHVIDHDVEQTSQKRVIDHDVEQTSQKHVIDHDVEQTSQKCVIDHDVEQTSQKRVLDHDVEQTSQKRALDHHGEQTSQKYVDHGRQSAAQINPVSPICEQTKRLMREDNTVLNTSHLSNNTDPDETVKKSLTTVNDDSGICRDHPDLPLVHSDVKSPTGEGIKESPGDCVASRTAGERSKNNNGDGYRGLPLRAISQENTTLPVMCVPPMISQNSNSSQNDGSRLPTPSTGTITQSPFVFTQTHPATEQQPDEDHADEDLEHVQFPPLHSDSLNSHS